jgi:hypothetical protein
MLSGGLLTWLQKCDEVINEDGECKACVRLHLECLGFGEKRPEWLQVSGSFFFLSLAGGRLISSCAG